MDKVNLLEPSTVTGENYGVSSHFYSFSYNCIDEVWLDGKVVPIHGSQEDFAEVKGSPMSFWTVDMEKENEVKQITSSLSQLSHDAFMQPLFCVHNSQINKIIMACSPGNSDFKKWISKQVPISSEKYITVQGRNMISSVILFGETIWEKGYVCMGLDDPKTYRMLDSKIKVIPFAVRKRLPSDDTMIHRLCFAKLLENEIYPKWKDPDLKEFTELLKKPKARVEHLLSHPLLLPPEKRLALYQILVPAVLSSDQKTLLQSLQKFDGWRSKIRPLDELYDILTYGGDGKEFMYAETTDEAFRFACNSSSHFMKAWRKSTHQQQRKIYSDYADKSLKKLFPGLLAQVYGLTFHTNWRFNGV